jgi:uncharacterized iron-regulated membrane protein
VRLLSLLHRWTGGLIGLLLALLGLSGAILVWEGAWVQVPGASDPVVENVATLGQVSEQAVADGAIRITFASEEIGLHHAAMEGGGGAYIKQDETVARTWASQWERPEFWLFDFHHHLFAGESGEWVTGIAGVAGLLFVITGAILWWRSRRAFEFRLLPRNAQPGPIVRHHRDLGIVVAPILLVSLITGVGMLYGNVARAVTGASKPAKPPKIEQPVDAKPPLAAMLQQAKARFPDAAIRRLSVPSNPDAPYSVRMRQPGEWTPNGRTTVYFDGAGKMLRADDALAGNGGDSVIEKLYPVHTAKVGGIAWQLAMTASGLALFMLGSFAVYSFWLRKANRRRNRQPIATVPYSPAT